MGRTVHYDLNGNEIYEDDFETEYEYPDFRTTEPTMDRAFFLQQAEQIVCMDREYEYGAPEDNFRFIAELWTAYLYNDNIGSLSAKDVAIMMALFKIGRMTTGKPKVDNWVDAIGYLACGAELEASE
jgi:hypothetical protein